MYFVHNKTRTKSKKKKELKTKGNGRSYDVFGSAQILNIDVLRFHPFFSKITYQGLRDLLYYCNLITIEKGKLLYRE
jgi:hypothetical protein